MKHLAAVVGIVACVGFIAVALAQDFDYVNTQSEVMECSPPKFMLVANVDMDAKTITGMLTKERNDPERVLFAYHMTIKHSDITVTNSRRIAVAEADLSTLKGKLVVFYDGKQPLSAPYLGLFREDTIIVSFNPAEK